MQFFLCQIFVLMDLHKGTLLWTQCRLLLVNLRQLFMEWRFEPLGRTSLNEAGIPRADSKIDNDLVLENYSKPKSFVVRISHAFVISFILNNDRVNQDRKASKKTKHEEIVEKNAKYCDPSPYSTILCFHFEIESVTDVGLDSSCF